jgi:hypothetical protein
MIATGLLTAPAKFQAGAPATVVGNRNLSLHCRPTCDKGAHEFRDISGYLQYFVPYFIAHVSLV